MTLRQIAAHTSALFFIGLAGCASLPDWPGVAAASPASPHAATASYTPPVNPFASAIQPIDGANAEAHQHDEMVMYTCPMHPEIRSSSPGECPKCGMALTPLKPVTKHDDHDGGGP